MKLDIRRVKTQQDMDDALAVRRAVFIEEQQVAEADEIDHYDRDGGWLRNVVHLVGYIDGRPIATGRLILDSDEEAHIGRLAVVEEERRKGFARQLMFALHKEARALGYRKITLAAQLHAIPFYETLGYVASGDVFLDTGIEHRRMDVDLEPEGQASA